MIYEYNCTCGNHFEVIKSHTEMERIELCSKCQCVAERQFIPKRIHLYGTSVTHAEYNPGLGKVINNKRHLDDECKRRGVVPIGNDYGSGEKMLKESEKAVSEKIQKRWESDDV